MPDPKLFDVRVVEYHIRRGATTRAEYNEYLASLEDEAEHGNKTETNFADPYGKRHYASFDHEEGTGMAEG